jgi:NhaA family Na+:H+ antiporter
VSFSGVSASVLTEPLTLGVASGLVLGKVLSVLRGGRDGAARRRGPGGGRQLGQMFGVSLLCGIGFTMSLFIGLLAFDAPAMQDRVKFGILAGSLVAGWPAMPCCA